MPLSKSFKVGIVAVIVAIAVAGAIGGRWLWQKLLELHGQ
jgi:hypothetical protein